jgi:LSD1 subclass zinc finger protein
MSSCPECGAEVEYSVEEARVLTGTCGSCHKVTTLFQGTVPLGTGTPTDGEGSGEAASNPASGLECSECGSPLGVEATADGSLEVRCAECETVARFVPETRAPSETREPRESRERPQRGGYRERGPPGGAPNARPCRQCGAPLTFTTDENGQLTGECSSCGNRFTLPPRRDNFGGGARRGPPRYGGDRGGGYDRRPGGWSSGGSGYRGGASRDRRRPRDADDSDDARSRRRKRRE